MLHRALVALLAAALALPAQDSGAALDKVSSLAKEGHTWEEMWATHSALLGKPAPKLKLAGWINGKVTPEDMLGKIVIVDFWATWCGPCIQAIPHNNALVKKYGGKDVLFIGVHGNGGEENMSRASKECGIRYPIARTTPGTLGAWKIKYYPTYAIIDRKGTLRALGVGASYIDKIVDTLLEEQPE